MGYSRWTHIAIVVGLLLMFLMGVTVRRAVLDAQYALIGSELPFTLESALQFRMVERVSGGEDIPAHDADVQYPDGVEVRQVYSVGAEYIYALGARLMAGSMPLEDRVRWVEVTWFCLGICGLVLWVRWLSRSWIGGWVAGCFYAVGISSVIRSTGQELSRENFAIPLLLFHLAFDAWSARSKSGRAATAGAVISAVFLAAAAAGWDLLQFYVLLWAAGGVVKCLTGRFSEDVAAFRRWGLQFAALLAVSAMNPYLRFHGWLWSPGLLLGWGVVFACVYRTMRPAGKRTIWICLGLCVVPLAAGWLLGRGYGASYGHFGELLLAKLRFLGRKPADPSLLSFEQRIMWGPALHTADLRTIATLFPAILLLTLAGGVLVFSHQKAHPDPDIVQLLIFCGTSLIAFCLFVRFHVFLAISACAVLGCWAGMRQRKLWVRMLVLGLLLIGWVVEASWTMKDPVRWGRPNVYYVQLRELTDWLRREVAPEPVLANFGVSASILTYGDCPIVLHPKFETQEIRRRVESYGEALFRGTEKDFRDWADQYGVRYYVYAMGEFSSVHPEQQMRYFVDALEPREDAAARMFEKKAEGARYFRHVWSNAKYAVFAMTTCEDEREASVGAAEALEALQQGDLDAAEQSAESALARDPLNAEAIEVLRHVDSLRAQGFEYEGPGDEGDE